MLEKMLTADFSNKINIICSIGSYPGCKTRYTVMKNKTCTKNVLYFSDYTIISIITMSILQMFRLLAPAIHTFL